MGHFFSHGRFFSLNLVFTVVSFRLFVCFFVVVAVILFLLDFIWVQHDIEAFCCCYVEFPFTAVVSFSPDAGFDC